MASDGPPGTGDKLIPRHSAGFAGSPSPVDFLQKAGRADFLSVLLAFPREGERHGSQARPHAPAEGAVERPAPPAAGTGRPAALQQPENENFLDKHQDKAQNLAKCL